jgi:endonuclease III
MSNQSSTAHCKSVNANAAFFTPMSISRYFLPKAAKKASVEASPTAGGRCKKEGNCPNEDIVILIQSDDDDDNDEADCKRMEQTADMIIAKDSVELNETVTVSEEVVVPNAPIFSSSENRFAQWARPTVGTANTTNASWSVRATTVVKPQHHRTTATVPNLHIEQVLPSNKKRKLEKGDSKKSSSKPKSFTPMTDMSEAEQQNEIEKWHSLVSLFQRNSTVLADDDDDAPQVEQRRFHMLITTLLHARCQEPCVRQAIQQLHVAWGGGAMTVQSLAQCTVETIQPHITNLQYHNTKAKYLIAASQYIRDHCPGHNVPSNVASLLRVPGIGPLFADLHAFVNTPSRHLAYMQKQKKANGLATSTASLDVDPKL